MTPPKQGGGWEWDWLDDPALPHGGLYVVRGRRDDGTEFVMRYGPLKHDYEMAKEMVESLNAKGPRPDEVAR